MFAHLFLLFERSIATQAAAAAGAAMMSSAFARSNFAAAAPAAAAALSLSVAQLAHLHTAFLLGYLVGHVPAGLLADSFGGARVLLYAALAWSGITCAHALVGVAPPGLALPLLAALRFGVGVASAAAVPALAATLAQMLPEAQRAKIMSASYGFFNIGTAACLAVTPALCDALRWHTALAAVGAACLAPLLAFRPLLPCLARRPQASSSAEPHRADEPAESEADVARRGAHAQASTRTGSSHVEHMHAQGPRRDSHRAEVGSPGAPGLTRTDTQSGAEMQIRSKGTQSAVGTRADGSETLAGPLPEVDADAFAAATGRMRAERDGGRAAMQHAANDGRGRSWGALLALAWAHSAIGWGFFTFSNWIPQYVHTLSAARGAALGAATAAPWAATALAAFAFGALFAALRGAGLSPFAAQTLAHTAACLGGAAALFPLASAAAPPSAPVALACMGAALALQTCNYSGFHAYVQTYGEGRAGSILGVTNSCGIVAGIVANAALAWVVGDSGSYAPVFQMTMAVYASSWAAWMLWLRGEPIRV